MQVTESEIARRVEQVFAFVTQGFNFESFRDLSFALLFYYRLLDLPSVLKDQWNKEVWKNKSTPGAAKEDVISD